MFFRILVVVCVLCITTNATAEESSFMKGLKSLTQGIQRDYEKWQKEHPTYPLRCRFGGRMVLMLAYHQPEKETTPFDWLLKKRHGSMILHFTKSSIKAGKKGENLKPGCCGWLDRGMHSDEPEYIILHQKSFSLSVGLKDGIARRLRAYDSKGNVIRLGLLGNPNAVKTLHVRRDGKFFIEK